MPYIKFTTIFIFVVRFGGSGVVWPETYACLMLGKYMHHVYIIIKASCDVKSKFYFEE